METKGGFGSLVSLSFPSVFIGKMDPENSLCFQFPASRYRKQETDEGRRKQKWKTEAKSPL
jgi:hypothetical protein